MVLTHSRIFGITEKHRPTVTTADSISFYFRLDFSREFRKNWNMSRPLGLPKTGGRVRGTPNRKSADLLRRLKRMGCDPIEGLARIALDPEIRPELRVRCFAELAQYVYPKRKAVEADSHPVNDLGGKAFDLDFGNLPMPNMTPKVGFSEQISTATPTATTATPKPSELLAQTGKVPETVLKQLRTLEAAAERGDRG